jgi:hypothetical protein
MKDTKFEKEKKRINEIFTNTVNEHFFRENYTGILITATTYLILKKSYNENGVYYFKDFKKEFSKFYGIKRFVDDNFIDTYYMKMDEFKGENECNVKKLAKELIDSGNKVQFSFATKMLNIMNDEKYPIYDSNVAKAFGIYTTDCKNIEDKIEDYVTNYMVIGEVYNEMISKHSQTINDFRETFKYTKSELSDMRIIDIIVWKIGEKLMNKQLEIL